MSFNFKSWLDRYTSVVTESETLCFITRAEDLRQVALKNTEEMLHDIGTEKAQQIERHDENAANFLLALELMLSGIAYELRMWSLLRADHPDAAWDDLICAQNCLANAARAHSVGKLATRRVPWLESVERTIFPPQVFMSPGMIVGRQRCSVCSGDYGDCGHVVGRAYMGQMCTVHNYDVRATEVSFVDVPADKRHRVIGFIDEAGYRNRMTWRVEPRASDEAASGDQREEPPVSK